MNKKISILVVGVAALLLVPALLHVNADSEIDGEDFSAPVQSQPQSQPQAAASSTTGSVSSPKMKTVTQTIVVTPAKVVTENQVQTISLPDSDRDGIADSEDPHPYISEIYIVQDKNLNGIVDTFEYGN